MEYGSIKKFWHFGTEINIVWITVPTNDNNKNIIVV